MPRLELIKGLANDLHRLADFKNAAHGTVKAVAGGADNGFKIVIIVTQ